MNYRHIYHAGNACDVVKHALLIAVLTYFRQKGKPFGALDTHAGTGLYSLESPEAIKTFEYEQGIKQVWKANCTHPIVQAYVKIVHQFNPDGNLRNYPGSPLFIEHFLQATDKLICAELHPEDGRRLKDTLKHDRHVTIHLQDGYRAPKALLPFPQHRGLVLIDPPFEQTNEFQHMLKSVSDGLAKAPQTVFMLWYPIKDPESVLPFYTDLISLGAPNTLCTEFYFYNRCETNRLNGTGIVIINAPWQIEQTAADIFKELHPILAFEPNAPWNIKFLKQEK